MILLEPDLNKIAKQLDECDFDTYIHRRKGKLWEINLSKSDEPYSGSRSVSVTGKGPSLAAALRDAVYQISDLVELLERKFEPADMSTVSANPDDDIPF